MAGEADELVVHRSGEAETAGMEHGEAVHGMTRQPNLIGGTFRVGDGGPTALFCRHHRVPRRVPGKGAHRRVAACRSWLSVISLARFGEGDAVGEHVDQLVGQCAALRKHQNGDDTIGSPTSWRRGLAV
jgi:hypothetical protein